MAGLNWSGTSGPDVKDGTSDDDVLLGLGGNDRLRGLAGRDLLDGGTGHDTLEGGADSDTYIVDSMLDVIVEAAGGGDNDWIQASASYDLLDEIDVERMSVTNATGTVSINLYGNRFHQDITGNAGENILSDGGKGAADILRGLGGDDIYRIYNSKTVVVEDLNEGARDTVLTAVTFDLLDGIHVEALSAYNRLSTAAIRLYGNAFAQDITGNAGNNIISDGGKGTADTLRGLGGNDTYRVYNSKDVIIEGIDEGASDAVLTKVTFDLLEGVYVEKLAAYDQASTAAIKLYGNSLKQEVTGNAGNNIISDGGKGQADILRGLAGDDTYHVYNSKDIVEESHWSEAQGLLGNDTVLTAVSFTLTDDMSIEHLSAMNPTSTAKINLYGNPMSQTITGNAGDNILSSGSRGYVDWPPDGRDVLKGLGGNDTYRVYGSADTIVEASDEGDNDTIISYWITYHMQEGVHVENLKGIEGKATKFYGNSFAQTITGTDEANTLHGGGFGGEADVLIGRGGADLYRIYNSADVIVEDGSGIGDVVQSAVDYALAAGVRVEQMRMAKEAGAIDLSGNEFGQSIQGNGFENVLKGAGGDDQLFGLGGNDSLYGGDGNDTMYGEKGADKYFFDTVLNSKTNVDTITEFTSVDEIHLSREIFTKAGAIGTLSSAAFVANNTGKAADTSDRIIYEKDTGYIYYDADGLGGQDATLFAKTVTNLPIGNADFLIY